MSRAVAFRRASIASGVGFGPSTPDAMISAAVADDVRGGHRRAEVVGRVAEGLPELARERELEDRAAGGEVRAARGLLGEQRVLAAAGRDEVEARAGVGVHGEAAVLGDRADRQRRRAAPPGSRRAGAACCPTPRRSARPSGARSGRRTRSSGSGSRTWSTSPNSNDRLMTCRRPAWPRSGCPGRSSSSSPSPRWLRTLTGMIVAPLGEAGQADAVVRRLGDRARDVRPVAVVVVGVGDLGPRTR